MSLLEFIYVLCAHILWIYELNSHNETKCNALEIKPFCTVFVLFFALSLYKCYCCCSQMFKRFETFSSSSTSLSHYCVFYSTCSIHAVAYRTLMLPLLLPAEKKSSIINKKKSTKTLENLHTIEVKFKYCSFDAYVGPNQHIFDSIFFVSSSSLPLLKRLNIENDTLNV